MTFISLPGIEGTHEPKVAPEGEYDLCIISAKMKEKDGKNSIMTVLEIEGEPDFANVFNYIGLPSKGDDDAAKDFKNLFAKRFFDQFHIEMTGDGVELEQFVGSRAKGKLIQQEYEGNITANLQVNRLPAEAAE